MSNHDQEINRDRRVKYLDSSFEPDHKDALPDNNTRVIQNRNNDKLLLSKSATCLVCCVLMIFLLYVLK